MNLVVLGKGKTGSLVAAMARERGHLVTVHDSASNPGASALTKESLKHVDVVIDFTTPSAVLENVAACVKAGANMVVGTTGWYGELSKVRALVEQGYVGLMYASNFSIGVNVYFDIIRAAASGLQHGYSAKIVERHHAQKKDSPSGTAVKMGKIIQAVSGTETEITSLREGDVVGTHVLMMDSENDTLMLVHDAKSRRGFAEGAVLAAEWLAGRQGFFDFKDVWKELARRSSGPEAGGAQ